MRRFSFPSLRSRSVSFRAEALPTRRYANTEAKPNDRLFPDKIGRSASQQQQQESLAAIPADLDRVSRSIEASESGYIQALDDSQLMQIATEHNLRSRSPESLLNSIDARAKHFPAQNSHF